jgi:leucyl-tRNA synthetase
LFILFAAPVENELRWSESGIEGAVRFIRRIYALVWQWQERLARINKDRAAGGEFDDATRSLRRKTHQTIAKVTNDLEHLHLNTSVAALMELLNAIGDLGADPAKASEMQAYAIEEALESLVTMLTPFAPHAAEEMWEALGHSGGILKSGRWPVADADLARKAELEIPVQVNGKLRSRILASPEVSEEEVKAAALADEKIATLIAGRQIVKVIVVPQRLVNVVVR